MTLSAVLLAGGESRRMGTDKATALFAGAPLWKRQLRLLRLLEPEEVFVSARMEPVWRPPDVPLVLDKPPSRGPMTGIAAALAVMKTSHLLALAVDMPFVTKADVLTLVSSTKNGCGAVPLVRNRAEPLAAIYAKESEPEFAAALSGSDTSVQLLITSLSEIGQVQLVEVSGEAAERYRSVNWPKDLAEAIAPEARSRLRWAPSTGQRE